MTHKIKAVAPTHYQYRSVSFFGDAKKKMDGSFVFEKEFETEQEAKDYLHQCIDYYCQIDGSEEEIEAMRNEVEESGCLTYDAVTANIVEL